MIQIPRSAFAGGSPGMGGGTAAARRMMEIIARYDNAMTTDENRRTWWMADFLSAKSANNFQVRRQLRNRSRYEVGNNPYLFGVCNSNADDLIGSGPTLQIKTSNKSYNRAVEAAWNEWCAEVSWTEKLRTCKLAKTVDGEGFLINKNVDDLENPVKIYPVDVEADQVTTTAPKNLGEMWVDGMTLHPITGRPTHYHVLKHHPGDYYFPDMNPLAIEKLQARHVIHWFPKFRPGQVRGIPIFTSSLDLFGELRAFRKAVLANAQLAASLTALLESSAPAVNDDSMDAEGDETEAGAEIKPFAKTPITRGMAVTLPAGFKVYGFDPKQPQTTYEMFQEKCLGEAIRPLNYPLNKALGTSQKFNFSSSKLDIIDYRNSLNVERGQCETSVLEPQFKLWFEEAVLCGAIPMWDGRKVPPHEWHWPGYESIDPLSDAAADAQRIASGLQSWRDYWATRGKDWREVFAQLKEELDEQKRFGLQFGDPPTKTIREDDTEGKPTRATAKVLIAMAERILKEFGSSKVNLDDPAEVPVAC